jgi:hypothetical protein
MIAAASTGRLAWTFKRALLSLRWPGLLGIALLIAATLLALGVSRPMLTRLQGLEDEARVLSARSGGVATRPPTQRSQLANFYAFFPPTAGLPDMLARMQRAARDNGLTLEKGEYRLVRDTNFPLSRYQVTFPLRGNYAQVRGFVNDVLDTVPAAALEEMSLKRQNVADPVLEARVRFSLFLGTQP